MAATYTLPSTYSLPLRDYIYKACETLVGQHPVLSAITLNEDKKDTYFARLPEIKLDQCVSFKERRQGFPGSLSDDSGSDPEGDAELDELLEVQHNLPFAAPLPFWRLCILTDPGNAYRFTAAYVYHHALGDGGSGSAFHRTFLRALHDACSVSSADVQAVVSSPKTPLLPNVEQIHPMPLSMFYILSVLFKARFWKSSRDPSLWTGSKITAPLENKVRHVVVSKRDTTALKDLCRKNSTTITAALQALVASALFATLPKNYSALQCDGAISNRRWLSDDQITDDSLGVWVQDFAEHYRREGFAKQDDDGDDGNGVSFSWDEARRSKRHLDRILASRGKNSKMYLLKYVNDYANELFLPKVGKDRDGSFEVSNIGVFRSSIESEDGPRVGRMVFSQSANVCGAALAMSVVTGADGCLTLGFTWQSGVVDDDLVSAVIAAVKKELNAFGET